MSVVITQEMFDAAVEEANRREAQGCIRHHFSLEHLSDNDRNVIGFLGEFACKEDLGLNWRQGIREDYLTIDSGDIVISEQVIDIKTETIPKTPFWKIIKKEISDDEPYGRRLIVEGQINLLHKYDYVVWGAFLRGDYTKWYGLGYLESRYILDNYSVQKKTPFGGEYPEACLAVRTSELKPLIRLGWLLEG